MQGKSHDSTFCRGEAVVCFGFLQRVAQTHEKAKDGGQEKGGPEQDDDSIKNGIHWGKRYS